MKTIIVGFDAFDPGIFEKLHSEGKTPNLSKFVDSGGYSQFAVPDPPQSEVSWTSIATGMDPGGHGIFDFVHRNPKNYGRDVSLLPTKTNVLGRQFIPPHESPTIFDAAVDDGYPGISLWWPATFPARLESPVWSIPGLGVPDIFGRLGVGINFSIDGVSEGNRKTRNDQLTKIRKGHYRGDIEGPVKMSLRGVKQTSINFELMTFDDHSGKLLIGKNSYTLEIGKWSPFLELTFKVGFGMSIKAVTRVVLTQLLPEPVLYFLPLQLHPLRSPWPYGTPKRLLKEVWNDPGPYLTLGWPQDTTGLEEGFINDEQFLALCDQICEHRELTLLRMLDTYDDGVIACVFDSMDRIQHMFLRDRKDIIESWYTKLDSLLGRIQNKIQTKKDSEDINLLVVSDHGFGEFSYKVNLNRWLVDHDYLVSNEQKEEGDLDQANWNQSQAYAIGLNSVYLNLSGREGQGIIQPGEKDNKSNLLREDLLSWKGPDDRPVIRKVLFQDEAFSGPYAEYGPDLVIGYNPGYRASAQTGLGQWDGKAISKNIDHWGADHCFSSESVPGVIFSNKGFKGISSPSYADFPILAIDKELTPRKDASLPSYSDEDQEKVEERLKELGYL